MFVGLIVSRPVFIDRLGSSGPAWSYMCKSAEAAKNLRGIGIFTTLLLKPPEVPNLEGDT